MCLRNIAGFLLTSDVGEILANDGNSGLCNIFVGMWGVISEWLLALCLIYIHI